MERRNFLTAAIAAPLGVPLLTHLGSQNDDQSWCEKEMFGLPEGKLDIVCQWKPPCDLQGERPWCVYWNSNDGWLLGFNRKPNEPSREPPPWLNDAGVVGPWVWWKVTDGVEPEYDIGWAEIRDIETYYTQRTVEWNGTSGHLGCKEYQSIGNSFDQRFYRKLDTLPTWLRRFDIPYVKLP